MMRFSYQGSTITLTGTHSPTLTPSTFHQLTRVINTNAIEYCHDISMLPHSPTYPHYFSLYSQTPLPTPDPTLNLTPFPPELAHILETYASIFSTPHGLPPNCPHDHHIHLLPNSGPVNARPYHYPHFQKEAMAKLIAEMLEEGIIRPSTSPYSSPVLWDKKKYGSWQFCVDYRALNAITIKDRFPIPTINELLDELKGACYFSKIDLWSGYHQICLAPEDIPKTEFHTVDGHYELLVMPFGLTNAPSTFQAAMNDLLQPYLWKFVLVFFDDILIYSPTWSDHLFHVDQVLHLLLTHHFYAKFSKCSFGVSFVDYLGHIISGQRV